MDAGVIAEGPPTETAQLIWATIHGWVSLELLGLGFVEDQDAAYDRLHDALLRVSAPTGLTSPGGEPGSTDRGSGRSRFQWRATFGNHFGVVGRLQGDHPEAGDGALAAFVVAVEDVDRERLHVLDVLAQRGVVRIPRLPDGGLPESDVAGRDVQVTCLHAEIFGRRVRDFVGPDELGQHRPPKDHREPRAHVAQRDGEIDAPVD